MQSTESLRVANERVRRLHVRGLGAIFTNTPCLCFWTELAHSVGECVHS